LRLEPGARLGPYEIIARIGSGGMGDVYRARDMRLERDVAIKVLPPAVADDPDRRRRFEQEARAVAALNHPHVSQIYDVGPGYLVLEYVEGASPRGPLPPDAVIGLALQLVDALEAAHARGILHRDLKPANILVSGGQRAKLLDFGLAKLLDADVDATQTRAGTIVGTAAYLSPEQAEGRSLDARSDIFSLGAVIYELLSGTRAFDGETLVQVVNAVVRHDPLPPPGPPGLVRLVQRCLAKSPADRFPSMSALKAALERAREPDEESPSIAVLPFADMSPGRDHEWFSDGLAEEIINALAHIRGLRVIARTSAFAFKGKQHDIRHIASALGVTTVLEGSVRTAGSRIRVTTQLVSAADGGHLWSERYDRDLTDVFAIQDEIAHAIGEALRVTLSTPKHHHRRHTPNLAAYDAFLKGRYQLLRFTPQSLVRSHELFEQAIRLDPSFALAHIELGWCLFTEATENFIPARDAAAAITTEARRALEIDPSLPDAGALLAVAAVMDYRWAEAERLFRAALSSDSVSPMGRYGYSLLYLSAQYRMPEAVREMSRLLIEDPLNLAWRAAMGMYGLGGGNEEQGAADLRQILELDDRYWLAHLWLVTYCLRRQALPEAVDHAEKAYAAVPRNSFAVGLLAGVLAQCGDSERADRLKEMLGTGEADGAPAGLVCFHAVVGDIAAAAAWFEKAIDQRDTRAPWILPHILGDLLISSQYWPGLAKRMKLPLATVMAMSSPPEAAATDPDPQS
jgi:serine/threonine-protein kinase